MISYNLTHLKELESEAIFVLREVAAQFEKPVMLFSTTVTEPDAFFSEIPTRFCASYISLK